jgi:hypothetical protein
MVSERITRLAAGERLPLAELCVERTDEGWTVAGPAADGVETLPCDPDAIRERVRRDASGRYRPLSGARSLPGGWRAACATADETIDAIEAIYPLAVRHTDAWERGALRIVPLDDVLTRQSGRYEVAGQLSEAGHRAAIEALCSRCVRVPVWRGDDPGDGIPCPEACSVMVALCREAAVWERDGAPEPGTPDESTPFAAFEQPGNEVRETYLAARYTTTEVS